MKKVFCIIFILLLLLAMSACGESEQMETNKEVRPEKDSSTEQSESMQEIEYNSGIDEQRITKANFDFETRTVMLNSGYEMPINGLGTYSLHGDECIDSVKAALANGVRLIDTASAYGNEEEVGQAIREAIDEGII